jgi:hypothetical protein
MKLATRRFLAPLLLGVAGFLLSNALRPSDPSSPATAPAVAGAPAPSPGAAPPLPAVRPTPTREEPAGQPRERFAAQPGQHFVFRLDARWQTRLHQPLAAIQPVSGVELRADLPRRLTTSVGGNLHVVVLSYAAPEYVLRFHLDPVRVRGARDRKRYRLDPTSLRAPAVVRFSDDGRVLGFTFAPGTTADVKRLLASLFALSHQFVTREDTTPWTVAGLSDENGAVSARFSWREPRLLTGEDTDLVLHRQVLGTGGGPAPAALGAAVAIGRSDGEATLAGGWIAAAAAHEERRGSIADALDVVASVRLRMTRLSDAVEAVDAADVPPPDTQWDQAIAGRDETEPEEEAWPAGPARERLEARLAELRTLVGAEELDSAAAFESWREIASLVERSPQEVMPVVLERLRSGAIDAASAGWLLSAVGKAGSAGSRDAVDAIAGLLADPGVGEEVKLAALLAAHELGRHAGPVVDATIGVLLGSDAFAEQSALAPAAALLLGEFAGSRSLSPDLRAAAAASLEPIRAWAFQRDQPEVYFEALGNSGDPRLIAAALDYLDHPAEAVRRSASEALRHLEHDPRAAAALVSKISGGDSSSVRLAAITSLANLAPTPAATAALAALALGGDEEPIRTNAVTALGRIASQGVEEARVAIERAAADPNPEVRQVAGDLMRDLASQAG